MRITCHICLQPGLRVRKVYRRRTAWVVLGYALVLVALAGAHLALIGWAGGGLLAAETVGEEDGRWIRRLLTALLSVALGGLGWWLRARKRIIECPRCDTLVKVE